MTELGPYAASLAVAASAWGALVSLTGLWDRSEFRGSSRRAGAAAALLLGLAVAGLAWAAWTGDVRYRFVVPFTQVLGSVTASPASLLSPAPRFLILVTLLAGWGSWACWTEASPAVERRRWALLHLLTLASLLAAILVTRPWSSAPGAVGPPLPEALEPGAVLAGYLRLAAVAGFGVAFILLWSAAREIRQNGGYLRRPYAWAAFAWLCLTASVLSEYAAVEGRADTLASLEWVGRTAVAPWLLALAFLHAAGLGRRRPRGNLASLALGVAVFPLSFPLLAGGGARGPWALAAAAATALALTAVVRAGRAPPAARWAQLWSRDGVAVAAAIALASGSALAVGALLAGGSLPAWLWGGLAALAAFAAGVALAFPAIEGRPQRIALRSAPFVLLGFAVAGVSSFASGDLGFGLASALAALNAALAGREILSARPGRAGLWIWGAALGHTGLALAFTGVAAARLGGETDAAVRPGGLVVAEAPLVGQVQVRYLGLSLYRGPRADKWAVSVEVEGVGRDGSLVRAEQWALPGRGELYHVPATVRALAASVDVDLFEVISGPAEHVRLHVLVRPLAGALWLGVLLVLAGTICGLASAGQRARTSSGRTFS